MWRCDIERIRLEFAVEQEKIGGTTPMLAPPLDTDKVKFFE
jgi:hypothetical protein